MTDEVNPVSETGRVPVMYVRDVPEEVLQAIRVEAAKRGRGFSMKAWIMEAVREKFEREGVEWPVEDEQ